MTGFQLAGEIMKIRPGIPIILSTGYSNQIDEEKALKSAIKAFLPKPVDYNVLGKTVRDILG